MLSGILDSNKNRLLLKIVIENEIYNVLFIFVGLNIYYYI